MKYKPTGADTKIIRECAQRSAEIKSVLLEPGYRYNTDTDSEPHMNIAMVTRDENWDDTDLWGHGTYKDFSRGVELTEDGRGIFDFYVSGPIGSPNFELKTNVTAYIENGKLHYVKGTGDGVLWKRWPDT